MIATYYEWVFGLSLLLTMVYAIRWHKHFSVYMTLLFVVVPIANMGYIFQARAANVEEYLMANRVSYIGGCYLLLFLSLSIAELCKIRLPKWISVGLLIFSSMVYVASLTTGHMDIFYKSAYLTVENGLPTLYKEYGVIHTIFIAMLLIYVLWGLVMLIYAFLRKKEASIQVIILLLLTEVVADTSFFLGRKLVPDIELTPASYVFAQLVYLVIISRVCLYDITDTGIDSLVQKGDTGFVSFDFKGRYLGSNETGTAVFPQLKQVRVDTRISGYPELRDTIDSWLREFVADESHDEVHYETGGRDYRVNINYLYDGQKKRGYQLFLRDDTEEQEYVRLLSSFNETLQQEVEEKTRHIVDMHDNLILSMATMVESRDNSTGGHIRRTSRVVAILIDEIRKDGRLQLSDVFCNNLIKAAPMHDLGKIAVDDAVLRKPGRYTDKEYNKMKSHAAEGARIVHEILVGTEDDAFRELAENVAHYHHERWDGSGYPEGLKGEEIPLEARIMAIADVYDALVSKRVYKEKMSFEEADRIILEGMGKHFDKSLEPYYVAARPRLEAYYTALE